MLSSQGYAFEERRSLALITLAEPRKKLLEARNIYDEMQELCRRLELRYRTLIDAVRGLDAVTQLVRIGHSIGEIS